MAVQVTWGNAEHTYTLFKFSGRWTWEEYYQAIKDGYELTKDEPGVVNILVDMTEARLLPGDVLTHAEASMRQPLRSFDLAVIVSISPFVSAIVNIIERLYGRSGTHIKCVKTEAEAHQLLADHDRQQLV
ncbi:MAG: hypothetical protein IAE80_08010 [Anaerolinea sp.]|nr:hypothetical protein [Anaerolinea sp.]